MECKTFDRTVEWLEQYHRREVGEVVRKHYWEKFKNCTDGEFCKAVDELSGKTIPESGRFPSIEQLERALLDVREREHRQEKRNAPTLQSGLARERSPDGRAALREIVALFDGKCSRSEYLSFMRDMEKTKPNIGWSQAANSLEILWRQKNVHLPTGEASDSPPAVLQ